VSGALWVICLPVAHVGKHITRSAPDTCATGKHITRSTPDMRYGYIFTSGVLPAARGICATGSHIRCAAGKLFSSSGFPSADDMNLQLQVPPGSSINMILLQSAHR
jgi:hypothetical protein